MIIMSVDSGDARTGIAVCDKDELLASPVCVIEEYNSSRRLEKIAQKALELNAEAVVVGLPKNMDGSEGDRALSCRELSDKLKVLLGEDIAVRLCDERATTMLAHTYLNIADVKGRKRKKTVDAVAAVIILEDFISMRRSRGIKKDQI